MTVRVLLADRSYDLMVSSGNLAALGPFARTCARGTQAVLMTDDQVAPHARAVQSALAESGFRTSLWVGLSGEAQKCLPVVAQLYDYLADLPADRTTLIVAVGGGVIGDLAGFVAATFARGLPLLMVPTTLLAMVDSSVGGKVGINHPRAKNLIGAFYQPIGVWIDSAFLQTLPDREYRSGLAEVVKYGVILDADFFQYLELHVDEILHREPQVVRHIIERSCELKAEIVRQDEREETGVRAVLNYGHTFAHAFETVAGYGTWLHGEAVAAGMVCASRLAERRGLITAEATGRQVRLLDRFGLPTTPRKWPIDELVRTMLSDKKTSAGRLRFVLPRRIGEVSLFSDVPEADVHRVLSEMMS